LEQQKLENEALAIGRTTEIDGPVANKNRTTIIFFLQLLLTLARGVRRETKTPWSCLFSTRGSTLQGISRAADQAQRTVVATATPARPILRGIQHLGAPYPTKSFD